MEVTSKRMLDLDLGALERGEAVTVRAPEERLSADGAFGAALRRIASWGGAALGLALFEREKPGANVLILSAGECVRRGLPTAARASVLARSPLTGRLAEGQVGGRLGPYLSTIADALVLRGRTTLPGAVLTLRRDGGASLTSDPLLSGATPAGVFARLAEERGSDDFALLSIGSAGEARLPFASLASGGARPSFVGRGGLGAVFGGLGLKALVIERPERVATAERERDRELLAALGASPRLDARSKGGTMELYAAFAARGDLRAGRDAPLSADAGRDIAREASERTTERKGCAGCPTPCGLVFERRDGEGQRAHFSASHALGTGLGLERFEDSLELLARCDAIGADAKEVGAILALRAHARSRGLLDGDASSPPAWGDAARLAACIDELVPFEDDDHPSVAPPPSRALAAMRRGALAFAREFGLEDELVSAHGHAARSEASYASVLGQCVSSGGSDPMRSFPFLVDAAGRERLVELCADLGPLPVGAEDPARPVAKGRLVYWHENLVAAVDATGFCAFSTAGLLADGVCDLDRLAGWILPEALRATADTSPGRVLLAAGASLVLLRRMLDGVSDDDAPEWARARLDEPGMLDEYAAWRGLAEDGSIEPARLAALGSDRVLAAPAHDAPAPVRADRARVASPARHLGTVELRAAGSLGAALEPSGRFELALPMTVRELLEHIAASDASEDGAVARHLVRDGHLIPTVWRAHERLDADAVVESGDVLELVTAIAGG